MNATPTETDRAKPRSFLMEWVLVIVLLAAAGVSISRHWGYWGLFGSEASAGSPEQRQAFEEQRQHRLELIHDAANGEVPLKTIFALQSLERETSEKAFEELRAGWRDGYTPMLIELARFSSWAQRGRFAEAIDELTGQSFGGDYDAARRWMWNQPLRLHSQYGLFKAELYQHIDERFAAYFDDHTENAAVRLDEVRWGGVVRDGIPPLNHPEMVAADSSDARYLADTDVVFGIQLNGDARAYPKRILAWHEMFKDTFGPPENQVSVNGVYCTLCGSMIAYNTVVDGTHYELGTSGFLYRSNKLMYDHGTESMWNTLTGEPVIGPLVGQGIKLEPLYVVTTTWGQWKQDHPNTTVLSLDTGHRRDYGEGVAYQSYFATDRLMFDVPKLDPRLKNKAEVLALRFGSEQTPPTVIDTTLLAAQPIYQGEHDGTAYVVLTDPAGANRVYQAQGVEFVGYDDRNASSKDGRAWAVTEDALTSSDGQTLKRLPAHRAFWFGWFAAHPDTVLIQ